MAVAPYATETTVTLVMIHNNYFHYAVRAAIAFCFVGSLERICYELGATESNG